MFLLQTPVVFLTNQNDQPPVERRLMGEARLLKIIREVLIKADPHFMAWIRKGAFGTQSQCRLMLSAISFNFKQHLRQAPVMRSSRLRLADAPLRIVWFSKRQQAFCFAVSKPAIIAVVESPELPQGLITAGHALPIALQFQ